MGFKRHPLYGLIILIHLMRRLVLSLWARFPAPQTWGARLLPMYYYFRKERLYWTKGPER